MQETEVDDNEYGERGMGGRRTKWWRSRRKTSGMMNTRVGISGLWIVVYPAKYSPKS